MKGVRMFPRARVRSLKIVFFFCLFFWLYASKASALTIDTFDGASKAEATQPSVPSFSVFSSSNSIGGHRTLSVTKISGDLGIRLETFLGVLSHSQDAGVTGF